MTKTIKDNLQHRYISILEKVDIDAHFRESIINFISSYDGTNAMQFHVFMINLLTFLDAASEHRIKSKAYEDLSGSKKMFMERMQEFSKELDSLMNEDTTKS